MKYVLVDGNGIINTSVDLASDVGVSGARTYFVGIKQIPYENFIQLWRVMTEESYIWLKEHTRNPSSERTDYPGYIRWWEEDKEITDSELKV